MAAVRLTVGARQGPQQWLQQLALQEKQMMEHRAIQIFVELPKLGELEMWSLYLHDSEKLSDKNTRLLEIGSSSRRRTSDYGR